MVCGVHGRLAISAVDRILLGNQGSMMLIIELGLVVKLDLAPTTIIVNIEIIIYKCIYSFNWRCLVLFGIPHLVMYCGC